MAETAHRHDLKHWPEIEEESNQLARLLIHCGCEPGDRICMLLPFSSDAIVALTGIIKAGCVAVPLGVALSSSTVLTLLERCGCQFLLSSGHAQAQLEELFRLGRYRKSLRVGWFEDDRPGATPIRIEFCRSLLRCFSKAPLQSSVAPDNIICLLPTRESSPPKLVPVSRSAIENQVKWLRQICGISDGTRVGVSSSLPPYFLFSATMASRASNGDILVLQEDLLTTAARLDALRLAEATHYFCEPFKQEFPLLSDTFLRRRPKSLSTLIFSGGPIPESSMRLCQQSHGDLRVMSLYGSAETLCVASEQLGEPTRPHSGSPIGRPMEGTTFEIFNRNLIPVRRGEVGELFVRGSTVAKHYWNDPGQTWSRFLNIDTAEPGPQWFCTGDLARVMVDGRYYFVSRKDATEDKRVRRINLAKIERALSAISYLKESAVVNLQDIATRGVTLCCAFVPLNNTLVTPGLLRNALLRQLPPSQIPSQWIAVQKLPRGRDGSLDRKEVIAQARKILRSEASSPAN